MAIYNNVKNGILIPYKKLKDSELYLAVGKYPDRKDDIAIGPNNENGAYVNNGEMLQLFHNKIRNKTRNEIRVFSAEPMFNGVSPASLLYGGANPNAVFAAQEQWKRINRIKDDGTKYKNGGDKYITKLSKRDEEEFQKWYKDASKRLDLDSNPDNPNHAYDYRGYWKERRKEIDKDNYTEDFHFPDTYKQPWHPTFSNESKYAKNIKEKVGHWEGETFIPGSFNIMMQSPMIDTERMIAKNKSNKLDFKGIKTTGNRPYNSDYISYINKSLNNNNLSSTKRAAILANIIEESGGDPFAEGPGGFYGLLQWGADRYKKSNEKDVYKEIDNQLQYLYGTLNNKADSVSWTHGGTGSGYNSYKDAMKAFDDEDLNKAMHAFTWGYVRPAGKENSYNNRQKIADQIYKLEGFKFGGTHINNQGNMRTNKRKKAQYGSYDLYGVNELTLPKVDKPIFYGSNNNNNGNKSLITGMDWVSMGASLATDGITSLINQVGINKRKAPKETAVMLSPTKVKTRINIGPQLARMREAQSKLEQAALAHSASSRTRFSRIADSRYNQLENEMNLLGQKENQETGLINQNLSNIQDIMNQNAANIIGTNNRNRANRVNLRNEKTQATVQNWGQFVNGINSMINGERGLLARMDNRVYNANNLAAMSVANPYGADAMKSGLYKNYYNYWRNNYRI